MQYTIANKVQMFIGLLTIAGVFSILLVANSNADLTQAAANDDSAIADIYKSDCAKCHGVDGQAKTPKGKQTGATDFTNERWQTSTTDAKGIKVITNGHELMPAFKDKRTTEEIAGLMTYLRGFKKK